MESKTKNRIVYGIFLAAVIVYFLVFFTQIHPLIIFDGDDWTYISFPRNAVPMGSGWNPTRILPEILMPACGFIAAHIVAPITGNYIFSITIVCAAAVTLFIALYLHFFAYAIKRIFALSEGQVIAVAALFLLAHFWAFCRLKQENNIYLFLAADLTCYFYYIIPTLLNAVCVFLFETDRFFWKKMDYRGQGLLLLTVYLTICSNMYSSIVLSVYAGAVLLLDCILPSIREKSMLSMKNRLWENKVFLGIIAAWLLSVILETQGGRAQSAETGLTAARMKMAWQVFKSALSKMNFIFEIFFAAVVLVAFILLAASRLRAPEDKVFCKKFLAYIICAGVTLLYLILLCAAGNMTGYMARADVLLALFFYVFLILVVCGVYIIKRIPVFEIFFPLIICIVLFNCNTNGKTFQDTYQRADLFGKKTAYTISANIYDRVVAACQNGENEIAIYVPEIDGNNWPLATYLGTRISDTLYEHGQIDYPITVNIVPNNELCEESGLLKIAEAK